MIKLKKMKYTFEDLTKMQRLQTEKDIFIFNEDTQDLEFINFNGSKDLT